MKLSKIDDVFKAGSKDFLVEPNAASWGQVMNQLSSKPRFYYWIWRAAAMLLMAMGWWLWASFFNTLNSEIIGSNNISLSDGTQVLANKPKVEVALIDDKEESELEVTGSKVAEQKKEVIMTKVEKHLLTIAAKSYQGITKTSPDFLKSFDLKTIKNDKITVTYIAEATSRMTLTSYQKLNKWVAIATASSPAELIGDLREVKNQLLRVSKPAKVID